MKCMSFGRTEMCQSKNTRTYEHCGYSAGHPWYYNLGGKVLSPKQILESVRASGYQGYRREDIEAAAALEEPRRSHALRAQRDQAMRDLARNLSGYRARARELRNYREEQPEPREPACSDIHTNISLKHNHLFNDFAHLIILEEHLARQPDLFG